MAVSLGAVGGGPGGVSPGAGGMTEPCRIQPEAGAVAEGAVCAGAAPAALRPELPGAGDALAGKRGRRIRPGGAAGGWGRLHQGGHSTASSEAAHLIMIALFS